MVRCTVYEERLKEAVCLDKLLGGGYTEDADFFSLLSSWMSVGYTPVAQAVELDACHDAGTTGSSPKTGGYLYG